MVVKYNRTWQDQNFGFVHTRTIRENKNCMKSRGWNTFVRSWSILAVCDCVSSALEIKIFRSPYRYYFFQILVVACPGPYVRTFLNVLKKANYSRFFFCFLTMGTKNSNATPPSNSSKPLSNYNFSWRFFSKAQCGFNFLKFWVSNFSRCLFPVLVKIELYRSKNFKTLLLEIASNDFTLPLPVKRISSEPVKRINTKFWVPTHLISRPLFPFFNILDF